MHLQWHTVVNQCPLFHGLSLPARSVRCGCEQASVCGHSERYDFTTQARLIYVGKALRALTESEECGED